MSNLLNKVSKRIIPGRPEVMSLEDYLDLIKTDSSAYATPAQRMLKAIGEPKLIDTSLDPKLSRIWGNEILTEYEPFKDFFGMNKVIENAVSYFRHAAQGLEESRQILYLLGPVGSAKSSLATRFTELMQTQPIYVLSYQGQLSPVFESPLGLFKPEDAEDLGVPARILNCTLSPWAVKRLEQAGGDLTKFSVRKIYPSILSQTAISRVEPGDENNQDQTTIIGDVDISKIGLFPQTDADAYSYTGGLCRANQGIMEFVEMFKAPIKLLNPLLSATQEGHYAGNKTIGALPFKGIIIAHSNESEWESFRNNKTNEAFLDRIYIVKAPYVLQRSQEEKIYLKTLTSSELSEVPKTPEVLKTLATFICLTRLKDPLANGDIFTKLKTYDGENMKEQDKGAQSAEKYRLDAGVDEGMTGLSTRFAFKLLSKTANYDPAEVAIDSIHLFAVIEDAIKQAQFPDAITKRYLNFLQTYVKPEFKAFLEKEINRAYLDSHEDYGQNLFNRYIELASQWVEDNDFIDHDTGSTWDKSQIHQELQKLEKPAGIVNEKDFRNEVVRFVYKVRGKDKDVNWRSYPKMADVIEKNMFTKMEDLLPVISDGPKESNELKTKHNEFVQRMMAKGYTQRQVKRLVKWFYQGGV